ncbi:MAG: argininosuccinate lyase [Synergistaceae bacterium]|jgi:argininosuccinate lyase|nr:argininosuccinate lyase [Synergistaceae bacterium]
MWQGRFKEDTAQVVLKFTQSLDVDWRLYEHDIRGSIAHVRMLGAVGLLKNDEVEQIEKGLGAVREEIRRGDFQPSERLEDVHMNIESRLTELLGPVGAKLHTGRSRNDQIATTVRLYLRDCLLDLQEALLALFAAILDRAEEHADIVVSGYTHLQQAQPVSMGHYWMAWFESFLRDYGRLEFALSSLSECPLGAGALAGSTLPLDREMTSRLLGFDRPTRNSMDSIAQRDYMADYHHFAALFAIHASRLSEDLVIFSSQEFNWLKLPDSFCTGSSIMPQKKNPDVPELIRGKTGQVVGHMLDLLITMKGLPMTYDRDLQEDKRGLFASLNTIGGVLEVLVPLIAGTDVDEAAALAGLERGFALATDVAEYLVRRGMPFRDAHWKVGRLVKYCIETNRRFADLSLPEWREQLPEVDEDLLPLLTFRESVERRQTFGGAAFSQVRQRTAEGRAWLSWKTENLTATRKNLEEYVL